jgi:hypothetical protein
MERMAIRSFKKTQADNAVLSTATAERKMRRPSKRTRRECSSWRMTLD